MNVSGRPMRDEGVALILALILLIVMAILVAAMADRTGSQTNQVDKSQNQGDGFYEEQLVHLDNSGNVVRVLTNHLAEGGGFTLQRTFGGIMINMVLVHEGNGTVSPAVVRMSRLVTARN